MAAWGMELLGPGMWTEMVSVEYIQGAGAGVAGAGAGATTMLS